MKAKFKVSHAEMMIYKGALKDKLIVTLPGVQGKHVMNELKIDELSDDSFELSVDYGKVVKSGRSKPVADQDI